MDRSESGGGYQNHQRFGRGVMEAPVPESSQVDHPVRAQARHLLAILISVSAAFIVGRLSKPG
jgi:hypothetical protein